ncbi:hypothetical protein J8N05_42305 [Streptomyces sp. BH-SS-21]|uniref:Uncharacterized protein n=1 Tax=Streptomyces liliiviolaceus TaxID=2823109 RepID=A0A940Y804_9ACTN|nr:hypothetical protein [Streptomyces liliiviolaceus]
MNTAEAYGCGCVAELGDGGGEAFGVQARGVAQGAVLVDALTSVGHHQGDQGSRAGHGAEGEFDQVEQRCRVDSLPRRATDEQWLAQRPQLTTVAAAPRSERCSALRLTRPATAIGQAERQEPSFQDLPLAVRLRFARRTAESSIHRASAEACRAPRPTAVPGWPFRPRAVPVNHDVKCAAMCDIHHHVKTNAHPDTFSSPR